MHYARVWFCVMICTCPCESSNQGKMQRLDISDFTDLCKEINLLEERSMKQRMHIQDAKLEKEGKGVVMDDDNEKEVAINGGQIKVFVLSDLSNSNKYSCANTREDEIGEELDCLITMRLYFI